MGKLADIKTKETDINIEDYLNSLGEESKRNDSFVLLVIMKAATGHKPKIWGGSIIGFGNKRYKSPATGREVDWFIIGFAPRKANLVLYLSLNIQQFAGKLQTLGKHKTGVGCLYINKLADIDLNLLKELIKSAAKSD
jgi:hypothetical protein